MKPIDQLKMMIRALKSQLGKIDGLQSKDEDVHKRLLLVAFLDAIAAIIYPKKSNQARFVSLLKEFSEWEDSQRISLPHLGRFLRMTPDPAFEKLRVYVFNELDSWRTLHPIPISNDPEIKFIPQFWPNEKDYRGTINGITLDSFLHCNLFYAQRNTLIHEFRLPGWPEEGTELDYPYYSNLTIEIASIINNDIYQLIYPTAFFKALCEKAIENFELYIERNRLEVLLLRRSNAFYWIEELNRGHFS